MTLKRKARKMRSTRTTSYGLAGIGAWAIVTASAGACVDPPQLRDVVVHVTVRTPEGAPVAGAPVAVCGFEIVETETGGRADAQGNVTIAAKLRATETRVALRPTDPETMLEGVVCLFVADAERDALTSVLREHYFMTYQWMQLQPGVQEYNAQVVAFPATRLHATTKRPSGEVDRGEWWTCLRGSMACAVANGGSLDFYALRRAADNELLFLRHEDGRVERVTVPAAQCSAAEVTLESIVLPEKVPGARTKIRITRSADATLMPFPLEAQSGVSVIATDGSMAFELDSRPASLTDVSNTEGVATVGFLENQWISLPPGSYYVASGRITQGVGVRLWDAIRAGRTAAEIEGAGIPKITVVANQDNEVTIDRVSAYQGLQTLCGFE